VNLLASAVADGLRLNRMAQTDALNVAKQGKSQRMVEYESKLSSYMNVFSSCNFVFVLKDLGSSI